MLEQFLRSKLRAKVLGWLFTHPDERYFVGQLASILKEDKTNLSRELVRLAGMGILSSTVEGRQKYYQANRACPVFGELRGLAMKTFGAVDVLGQLLSPLRSRIEMAFIFGSIARSGETSLSDMDVMIIGNVTFKETVTALTGAHERLGREVNPVVYSPDEFRMKISGNDHFLNSLLDEKKIFIIGDQIAFGRLAKKRLAD